MSDKLLDISSFKTNNIAKEADEKRSDYPKIVDGITKNVVR